MNYKLFTNLKAFQALLFLILGRVGRNVANFNTLRFGGPGQNRLINSQTTNNGGRRNFSRYKFG